MTSVLNINNSSTSELASHVQGTTSILSNPKSFTTFIIQAPCSTNTSDLLTKRFKSSHIGDLLMKKFKSQTANTSESNSLNQSPTTKALKEVIYDTSDNQSSIEEEVDSPTVSSFETVEKINLFPQRSISTPAFSNFNLTKPANQSGHKQLLNALDTLQKRIVEYQVLNLRETIIKAALLSQGPLKIPSLNGIEEEKVDPVKKIISELQKDDNDFEVYYGEVEYPLLHLAPKGTQVEEELKKKAKAGNSNKTKGTRGRKPAKMSNCSSPSDEQDDSLLDSLTATRAGTQRSEPEMTVNLKELSEQVADLLNQKGKKTKKNSKNEENAKIKETVKKNIKNEKEKKPKAKRSNKEALLSPVIKGRKMTERRKNKWQGQEDENELKI